MSQNTARQDSRARSEEEADDVPSPRARQPERSRRPRIGPDEPDHPEEAEFELIGDDDLGPADLGPANPNVTDPDADAGRVRKIS